MKRKQLFVWVLLFSVGFPFFSFSQQAFNKNAATGGIGIEYLQVMPSFCSPGYASLGLIGGEGSYTFNWSNGGSRAFEWLEAGIYSVTISDILGTDTLVLDSIVIEGLADAGVDQIMTCDQTILGGLPPINLTTDNTITYSLDQTFGSDVACRTNDGFVSQNGRLRVFDLLTDFNINEPYAIDAVEFGVFASQPNFNGNSPDLHLETQEMEVRIFTTNKTDLATATLTEMARSPVRIPVITEPSYFRIPISYVVQPGELIVVEIYNPVSSGLENVLQLGANETPTLNDNSQWIRSDDCGIVTPTLLSDIGFDQELVINLVQNQTYTGDYNYQWSPSTGLDDANSPNPTLSINGNQGQLEYTLIVIDDNGCQDTSRVMINTTAAGTFNGLAADTDDVGPVCFQSQFTVSTSNAPIVPVDAQAGYFLVESSTGRIATFNQAGIFDLAQVDFAAANTESCGIMSIHSIVYSTGIDPMSFIGEDFASAEMEIANGGFCASIESMGAALEVGCNLPNVMVQATEATCTQADAIAEAVGQGGLPPYTFVWSDGQTGSPATNLARGDYSITITDAAGCVSIDSFFIEEDSDLEITPNITDATCSTTSDGQVLLMPTGGSAPYSYLWDNGETNQLRANLSTGLYAATVTDANGCSQSLDPIEVGSPAPIAITLDSVQAPLCAGDENGFIDITPSGGTPPYTYTWSNGATTEDISDLMPGIYQVTINDLNCFVVPTQIVLATDTLFAVIDSSTMLDCANDMDGLLSAAVFGGQVPYTYNWSNGATTSINSNITAGLYDLTVTDGNNCEFVLEGAEVSSPPAVMVVTTVTPASGPSALDGSITAEISGGVMPYTLVWSNGTVNRDSIGGLNPGEYCLNIADGNNCLFVFCDTVDFSVGTIIPEGWNKLEVFPNPADQLAQVSLELAESSPVQFQLFDALGKSLLHRRWEAWKNDTHRIDLSQYPSGVHWLRIKVGDQLTTRRLVVQH